MGVLMSRYIQLAGYGIAAGFTLPAELQAAVAEVQGIDTDRIADHLIRDHAEVIAAEHIRPAFNELLAEVRKLPGNTATTVERAFAANPKGQSDYRKLAEFVARYQAILAAARCLYNCPVICDIDRGELFLDGAKVAPGNYFAPDAYKPAGPPRSDEFARLLYLAHEPDSGACLPSPAERRVSYEHFRQHGVTGGGNYAHNMAMKGDGWTF